MPQSGWVLIISFITALLPKEAKKIPRIMEIFRRGFVSGGHISLAGDSSSWSKLWLSANIYLKDYCLVSNLSELSLKPFKKQRTKRFHVLCGNEPSARDASERTGPLSSRSLPHCCQKKQRKYLGLWKVSTEDSSQKLGFYHDLREIEFISPRENCNGIALALGRQLTMPDLLLIRAPRLSKSFAVAVAVSISLQQTPYRLGDGVVLLGTEMTDSSLRSEQSSSFFDSQD
ncbi:hypothetical protein CDAR_388771 [Caerostris darwini]|uniref:Uncharacterized protein n=1 Tax=Caerostris darwini TaxID=1538125 RepID=A0AAV4S5M3_9ARAC|nr:hypothetical protein CDAR_388771 [Caerostris darwini]